MAIPRIYIFNKFFLSPVKGPDMVRGLSAGKHDYIVTNNYKIQILIVKTDFGSLFV